MAQGSGRGRAQWTAELAVPEPVSPSAAVPAAPGLAQVNKAAAAAAAAANGLAQAQPEAQSQVSQAQAAAAAALVAAAAGASR